MAQEYNKVTILLVEDDEVEAERVTRAFQRADFGYTIRRAWDGIEALDMLRDKVPPLLTQPVVILMDLKMPRMDGLHFLDEVRADPRLKHSVVFVLTTSQNEQDRLKAYDRQVAGYILKTRIGSDFSEIINFIHNYCNVVAFPRRNF